MKSLSSLERILLECIGKNSLSFDELIYQTGLQENICFNILQALVIRSLIIFENNKYKITHHLSPLLLEQINGSEAKKAESFEIAEAIIEKSKEGVFRIQKVAMDSRDEKIFLAMLSNLDMFLQDAHKKASTLMPYKGRKVVIWGVGSVESVLDQIIRG
jgi:hypothetical protein